MNNIYKTTIISLASLFGLAASAFAAAPLLEIAENNTLLIDDFEDGDYVSNLGTWDFYTEHKDLTTFQKSIIYSNEKKSKVLKLDVTFNSYYDFERDGDYAMFETAVSLSPNSKAVDLSQCTEISFDYKLDPSVELRFRILNDEEAVPVKTNYYSYILSEGYSTEAERANAVIHWENLEQIDLDYYGQEGDKEAVRKNALSFAWFMHSDSPISTSLEIDNIRCVNRPIYQVKFVVEDKTYSSNKFYKGETPYDPCDYGYLCSDVKKDATDKYMYTFTGWDKKITAVTEPTTYTAQFKEEEIPVGKSLDMAGKDTLWLEDFEDGNNYGNLGGPWDFFNSKKPDGSSFETPNSNSTSIDPVVSFEGSFKESKDGYEMEVRLTDYPENKVSFDYCFAFFGEDGAAIPKSWTDRQFADKADFDLTDDAYSMPLCEKGESGHIEFDYFGSTYPVEGSIRIKVKADGKEEGTEYALLKIIDLKDATIALDMINGGIPFKIFDVDKIEVQKPASSIVTVSKNNVLGIGNLAEPELAYDWLGARLYLLKDSSAVDMSQCEAIQYKYKGTAHEFRVESVYENGWQHYYEVLPASDDWKTATIYWNRLHGFDWTDGDNLPLKHVNIIKKKVVALTWQKDGFSIDADGKGTIEIDNVQCIRHLPEVLVEFYSEGKKIDETSVPYATYYKDIKFPKNPVKPSENGIDYVFANWVTAMDDDFQIMENTKFEATFVPSKKIQVSVFDDFEDGDKVGKLGGSWSISNSVSERASRDAIVDIEVANNDDNKWLKAKFKNEAKDWTRADVVLSMQKDGSAVDLSQCEAIQYDYRESTDYHQFHLGTIFDDLSIERDYYVTVDKDYEDNDQHEIWRTNTIYLDDMWCNNNCEPTSKVAKATLQLSWSFESYGENETFEIDNIKCLRTHYGAVTIAADQSKATFDGNYAESDELEIPQDIEVGEVEYNRTFEVGKASSIMLPFSIDVSKVQGGDFYSFAQMKYENGEWKAGIKKVAGKLEANKPYMFIPSDTEMKFNLDENEKVTLNTSGERSSTIDDWELRGTYSYIAFKDSTHLLGITYGFAAEERDGYKVGDYVKAGSGATIAPMRTYLVYKGSKPSTIASKPGMQKAPQFVNAENLPNSIIVEIIDDEGGTTAISTINAKTSRFHIDNWYDMRGRKLNSKPSVKGTYYNNGNMVIVK